MLRSLDSWYNLFTIFWSYDWGPEPVVARLLSVLLYQAAVVSMSSLPLLSEGEVVAVLVGQSAVVSTSLSPLSEGQLVLVWP